MTDIEKIQEEVERLMREYKNESEFRTVRSDTAKEFGGKILDFISSMEPEPMKQSESFLDQIQEYNPEEVVCHDLEGFSEGDIVYAFENEEYFACLFRMPRWTGEKTLKCPLVVEGDNGWQYYSYGTIFDIRDQKYRLATEEEINIFQNLEENQ